VSEDVRWLSAIRVCGWLVAIVIGALQTAAGRFPIGEDGVSYLDVADAYLRGDWHNALNAYWSPMYSWVLAAGLGVMRPSPFSESTVVHAINFLVYLAALAAFEFFLRQLLALHTARSREAAANNELRLPAGALLAFAYATFVWVTSQWISVPLETPDMCLSILVYLAVGILLRMRSRQPSRGTFAAYGAVLGLAFLTKSAMFPLAFVFFALLFLVVKRKTVWRGVATAVVAYAIVAGPFIAAISIAKGRFTTGDTGKLAYVWHANIARDRDFHWHAEFPDDKRPVHPTKKVFERPAVYAFGADPIGGSYPVWYDPSYWHEGTKVHVDLAGQLRTLHWSSFVWRRLFLEDGDFLVFGAFVLFVAAFRRWRDLWSELRGHAELLIPLLAALPLYSIVLLSPRYVAVFMLLFWLGLFASVRLPLSAMSRRLSWAVCVGIVLVIGARLAPWSVDRLRDIVHTQINAEDHLFWQIADGLHQMGAKPGDQVVGVGYGAPAYWARLAGVRIVGEVFGENMGFQLVPGIQNALQPDGSLTPEILAALRSTGATFVVARRVPVEVAKHGWRELGAGTDWFGLALRQ
jgi:4-amino-4-deoxy-L-arabinose transferase-like glycosyltransferase